MSSNDIKLEVCVDSIDSALAAEKGGAARIELCSALSEGGLTPTGGILKSIKDLGINIPVFCMLRPRCGNEFLYNEDEINAVLTDMEILRTNGADGFVFGALTSLKTIHIEYCQRVVKAANGLPVTFHRAFDVTNPEVMHTTVNQLKEIGFKRLLSSGFRRTAAEGIDYLAQLIAKHHRDFLVMPGAGITVSNLEEILTVTKCAEFHASAKSAAAGAGSGDDNCTSAGTRMECDVATVNVDSQYFTVTDADVVRKMVTIATAM